MKKGTIIGAILVNAVIFSPSCSESELPVEDFTKQNALEPQTNQTSAKYEAGKIVYNKTCIACHQADGKGIQGVFPPLANSDYLLEDINRAIKQVMYGSEEEMTVNGTVYNGVMPPQNITDVEIRDVINYILNSWSNQAGEVQLEEVQALRGAG